MASLLNFLLGLASGVVGGEMKSRVALCIICWFDFPFYFFSFLFFFVFFFVFWTLLVSWASHASGCA